MSVTVGEKITYVTDVAVGRVPRDRSYRRFRRGLARSRVDEILSPEVFGVRQNASPFLAVADEGTYWIRGHYSETSEEGKALLATCALYRSVAA